MTRRKSARYTLYRETAAVATNDWGDFVYFYLFFVRVFHANAFTRTLSPGLFYFYFLFFSVWKATPSALWSLHWWCAVTSTQTVSCVAG